MSFTLQLFVRNTNGITKDNNFPLAIFDSKNDAYDFIRLLSAEKSQYISEEYFVLNNPQLLPDDIRKKHMYQTEESISFTDGCFSIRQNIGALNNIIGQINDNTNEKTGFTQFVKNYPKTFSQL